MAKDDYFVVVYQLLKYLYECLKRGQEPSASILDCAVFGVNESYWLYIIGHLLDDGYVEGIRRVKVDGAIDTFVNFQNCRITPKGIQYLEENSSIEKAKIFLKDVKSIIPFI